MTAMVRAGGAESNLPRVVAHLPWGHIRTILDNSATTEDRDRYAAAAIAGSSEENGIGLRVKEEQENLGERAPGFTLA